MAAHPKFEVEMFEIISETEKKSLGVHDLTRMSSSSPWLVANWLKGEAPRVIDIASSASEEVRKVGFAGRLSIPGFHNLLREFVDQIGGVQNLPALDKVVDSISWAKTYRDQAQKRLSEVREAKWTKNFTQFESFWTPYADGDGDGYTSEPAEAYENWLFEDYVEKHPIPEADYDSPERKAWDVAYNAYVRAEAPPFVFATKADFWAGISAKDIREEWENDPSCKPDIGSMMENSLDDHHEDACDQVVAEREIEKIVAEWFPHAGSGDDVDLGLETKIADWNAKQRIVSYWPDTSFILPAFDGVTKAEAVLWCERHLSECEKNLSDLQDSWGLTIEKSDHEVPVHSI